LKKLLAAAAGFVALWTMGPCESFATVWNASTATRAAVFGSELRKSGDDGAILDEVKTVFADPIDNLFTISTIQKFVYGTNDMCPLSPLRSQPHDLKPL